MKSLAGARATVATAAVKGSAAAEEASSEASDDAERWWPPPPPPPLEPRHSEPWSPEELLHSFHFLPLPPPPPLTDGTCSFSYPIKKRKKKHIKCCFHLNFLRFQEKYPMKKDWGFGMNEH